MSNISGPSIFGIPENIPPTETTKTTKKRTREREDEQTGSAKKSKVESTGKKAISESGEKTGSARLGKKRMHESSTNNQATDTTTKKVKGTATNNIIVEKPPLTPLQKVHRLCWDDKLDEAALLIQEDPTLLERIDTLHLPSLLKLFIEKRQFDFVVRILELDNDDVNIDIITEKQLLGELLHKACLVDCWKAAYKMIVSERGKELLDGLCMDKELCKKAVTLIEMGADIDLLSKEAINNVFECVADVQGQESESHPISNHDKYGHLAICRIADKYNIEQMFQLVGEQLSEKSKKCLESIMRFSLFKCDSIKDLKWSEEHKLPHFAVQILSKVKLGEPDSCIHELKDKKFKEQVLECALNRSLTYDLVNAIKLIKEGISFAHITNKTLLTHLFKHCCSNNELDIAKKILQLPIIANNDQVLCTYTALAFKHNPHFAFEMLGRDFNVNRELYNYPYKEQYQHLLENLVMLARREPNKLSSMDIRCILEVMKKGGDLTILRKDDLNWIIPSIKKVGLDPVPLLLEVAANNTSFLPAICRGIGDLEAGKEVIQLIEQGADISEFSESEINNIFEYVVNRRERGNDPEYGCLALCRIADQYEIFGIFSNDGDIGLSSKSRSCFESIRHFLLSQSAMQWVEQYGLARCAAYMIDNTKDEEKTKLIEKIKNNSFKDEILCLATELSPRSANAVLSPRSAIALIEAGAALTNVKSKILLRNIIRVSILANKFDITRQILQAPSVNDDLLCDATQLAFETNPGFALEILKRTFDVKADSSANFMNRLTVVAEKREGAPRAEDYLCILEVMKKGGDLLSIGNVQRIKKTLKLLQEFYPLELLQLADSNKAICQTIDLKLNELQLAEQHGLANVAYWVFVKKGMSLEQLKQESFKEKVLEAALAADDSVICGLLIQSGVSFENINEDNLLNRFFKIACQKGLLTIAEKVLKKISNANFDPNKMNFQKHIFSFFPIVFAKGSDSSLAAAIVLKNEKFVRCLIEEKGARIPELIKGMPVAVYIADEWSEEMLLYFLDRGICNMLSITQYYALLEKAAEKGLSRAVIKIIDQIDHIAMRPVKNHRITLKHFTNFFEKQPELLLNSKNTYNNLLKLLLLIGDISSGRKIISLMRKSNIEQVNIEKIQLDLQKKNPELRESIREFFINMQYNTDPHHYEHAVDVSIPPIPNKPIIQPTPFKDYIKYFPCTNFTDKASASYVNPDKLLYIDHKMIEKLLSQFKKINFTDPEKQGYLNPKTIFHSNHETAESVQAAFERFVIKLATHEAYIGTPKEFLTQEDERMKKRNPELDQFYDEIEASLYHVMNAIENIQKPEEVEKAVDHFVCELLVAGPTCGGGISTRSINLYTSLVLNRGTSYKELLADRLEALRRLNLNSLVPQSAHSVHIYGGFMKGLGRQLGLSGTSAFEKFDDEFARYITEEILKQKLEQFLEIYTPSQIIDWILLEIKQTETLRTAFINDWLKKNVSHNFAVDKIEHYNGITVRFKAEFPKIDINKFKIKMDDSNVEHKKIFQAISDFLKKEENQIYINFDETVQEALDGDLIQEYLGHITDPKQAREFEQQVIASLLKFKAIQAG